MAAGHVPGVDGIKTGHADGEWSIVVSSRHAGRRTYVAVIGAPSEQIRDRDAACLTAFAQRTGRRVSL